jgi:gas vesicle protein
MANNVGKAVATLLIGAAVGAAVGYVIGTDSDKRNEQLDTIKDKLNQLKGKLAKKTKDIEEEIFHD